MDFFKSSSEEFYGSPSKPGTLQYQQSLISPNANGQYESQWAYELANNPLLTKQSIIVLREELEYFVIPSKTSNAKTNQDGSSNSHLLQLKIDAGNALLRRQKIFTALQRNVNKENNVAEQHLIDMLCMRYVFIFIYNKHLSF